MQIMGLRSVLLAGWAVALLLAASTASATELVSVNSLGDSGNSFSFTPVISADDTVIPNGGSFP